MVAVTVAQKRPAVLAQDAKTAGVKLFMPSALDDPLTKKGAIAGSRLVRQFRRAGAVLSESSLIPT
ncbi:MAG TPA: hypothetical protein VKA80_00800, partial [Beijerinckiaceae bacterium]|nr:hypothetical protein [Beijerinckiaceae bacterium]